MAQRRWFDLRFLQVPAAMLLLPLGLTGCASEPVEMHGASDAPVHSLSSPIALSQPRGTPANDRQTPMIMSARRRALNAPTN